jgi:hypothetical protein
MTNPWASLPAGAPFIAPDDQGAIERFNSNARPQHQLHLEIVPEPYLGNPKSPVVLLNGNPGFSDDDRQVHLDPVFNAAARANLTHERVEWPLYLLDPSLPSPGHDWWVKRLRPLAEAVGGYEAVSQYVFVAETHGYHAIKYRNVALPSQEYTKHLLRDCIARDAVVIIMRARSVWMRLVPELSRARVFDLNSSQNVTVSPRNCPRGFAGAVARIRAAA